MSLLPKPVKDEIVRLVADLAKMRFDQIQHDKRAGRLTSRELAKAIAEYGQTLAPLPDEAFGLMEVYPLAGEINAWSIDVPLWTKEEGRSDLTLSVTARCSSSAIEVEIDDLHVL